MADIHKKLSELAFNEIDQMDLLDNGSIYITFERNVRAPLSSRWLKTETIRWRGGKNQTNNVFSPIQTPLYTIFVVQWKNPTLFRDVTNSKTKF